MTPDASNIEYVKNRFGPKCSLWTSSGVCESTDWDLSCKLPQNKDWYSQCDFYVEREGWGNPFPLQHIWCEQQCFLTQHQKILPRMPYTLYCWKESNTVLMSNYVGLNLLAPRDCWEFYLKSTRKVRAQICRCKITFANTDHKGANVMFWSFALPSTRL